MQRDYIQTIQQMNTGDGEKLGIWDGISGYGRTLSRIFDENVNGMTYCKVSRHELVQSMSMMPNKSELIFQQDLAPWHIPNIVQVQATIKHKAQGIGLDSKEPRFESDGDAMVHFR